MRTTEGTDLERIKRLEVYPKCVLALMVVMVLVFAVLYPVTIARVGFLYHDVILVPEQIGGDTVYSGKLDGKQAAFTVSADRSVIFEYDGRTCGPYTAKEDETALPKDRPMSEHMTGVEVYEAGKLLFRGGVFESSEDELWLYNEDGSLYGFGAVAVTSNGITLDGDGNVVDTFEPSVSDVLKLMGGPEPEHKGEALAWFAGAFLCVLNALAILFADELFRWNLAFQIRNAEDAEPTELEIAGRYISWAVIAIAALVVFVMGLR